MWLSIHAAFRFLPFDGVFEVGLADCVVIQEDGGAGAVFSPRRPMLHTHTQ